MQQYKFSIIIPHKNIPNLLQRCLDSIPERSDVQVIIVDDNSDPDMVDFVNFPGLSRPNTEVYFDKSNKGAGRARNIGLEHVKGEWLLFADADDVFEYGIDEILNHLITSNEDIVYYKVISRDSDTLELTDDSKFFSNIVENGKDFSLRFQLLTPWIKAIRFSLIANHKIKFEETPVANDTRFSAMCGYYAEHVKAIPIIGYCWMRRNNSLWRVRNLSWYKTRYKVSLRIANFMRKNHQISVMSYFCENAELFIRPLEYISAKEYLIARVNYGLVSRNISLLIFWVPKFIIYRIKLHFK